MTRRKRYITILVLIVCAGALLIGYQLALQMRRYLIKQDDAISARNTRLVDATREIETNEPYVEKWDRIKGFQDELVEERQNDFTAYLQSLATQSNIVYEILDPLSGQPMDEAPQFQVLKFKLKFSTDLEQLVQFLAQLDSSERLLRVENPRITSKQRSGYGSIGRFLTQRQHTVLTVTVTVAIPAAPALVEAVQRDVLP